MVQWAVVHNLLQYILRPTHVDRNLLDPIFTQSDGVSVIDVKVRNEGMADHILVLCELLFRLLSSPTVTVVRQALVRLDIDDFGKVFCEKYVAGAVCTDVDESCFKLLKTPEGTLYQMILNIFSRCDLLDIII